MKSILAPSENSRIDLAASRQIAKIINAQRKLCWQNALVALQQLPPGATYVEGWIVTGSGLVIEHGWCQSGKQIIDPTFTFYDDEKPFAYFPGKVYSLADVAQAISEFRGRQIELPFIRLTMLTERDEYRASYFRAAAHKESRNR